MARQFKPGQLQTGSLFNISSSYALTASFALNGGGGSSFPYIGSAIISGSLAVTGSTSIRGTLNQASASLASGLFAHAQGLEVTASGNYSHAEGHDTIASGHYSHAEGQATIATGQYSHAEGVSTTTIASYSHAEGFSTTATGYASHAEGYITNASGSYSHAEGNTTTATGEGSHAEGLQTEASGDYQHVQGQYNQASSAQSAFIVGNGTSNAARSNLIFASGSQVQITGSVRATAGFTGSLQGTASNALNSAIASYANNAGISQYAELAVAPAGDWIPAKPAGGFSPYNLGSKDAAWNSLYVNNATIYFLSESVGNPTTSGSLSVVDDPIEGARFVLGTRDAVGQKKEIVISDKGASLAISASIAQTASYISPTFISQSAAASGFGAGGGGSITYVSSSNNPLSEIEVADYDSNVAVTFVNGRLKFIFGTPTTPSAPVASFNSTFATDRFNKVTDAYTVTGTIAVGGYTLISASLYEGGVLLTSTGSLATQLTYSTTTTGSHTYSLQVTASSPLDNSLNMQATTLTGTLSKTNPGAPTITPTATVQLGSTSNQIEQGATGSITFVSASGTANSWVHNFTSTNVTSPIYVTGSATGSSSITATATSYYSSSGVLGADNSPALPATSTATFTYTKIRSLRYGASTATAFTSAELENLAAWDTTLGGTVGTVSKGTTTASGQTLTITWTGDKYHYIVYNSSLASLTNITTGGFGVFSSFTLTTVGQYKVYRINTLQAGGAGTSITYVLT